MAIIIYDIYNMIYNFQRKNKGGILIRTLITLSREDKEWLDNYSHLNHQSTAETIRQAVQQFHETIKKENKKDILLKTSGMYPNTPPFTIDNIRRSKDN